MALPQQIKDKSRYATGFFFVGSTGTAQALTDSASTVFDADEPTCILIVSDAGCGYEVAVNPTGAGTIHSAPAGAFPIAVPAGEKVYISGTATISVVE